MKTKITITTSHQAVLDPAVHGLEPLLTYRRRSYAQGGPTGWRESVQETALFSEGFNGRMDFPAGLVPRVARALSGQGHRVEIEYQQPPERPIADRAVLQAATEEECAFLQAILDHPLGQLKLCKRNDAIDRCLLVAKVFHDSKIVFAVPTRREARRLWWRLETELGKRVGLAAGTSKRKSARCIVGTFEGLSQLAGNWEMLILPFAEDSMGNQAADTVGGLHFNVDRVYGLVLANQRRDFDQQLRLEAMVGPVIAAIGKPRSKVYVTLADVPECKVMEAETPIGWKRELYWANATRNQRIAEVCQAAAKADAKGLNELGADMLDFTAISGEREPNVTVLVETVEHARQLARLLPDWKVCKGPKKAKPKKKNASRQPRQMPRKIARNKLIVAAVYAAQHTITTQVLIRATGGDGLPRVKGFPPKTEHGLVPPPVVLIDFADLFHANAIKNTRRRLREYKRAGMQLMNTAAPERRNM